MRYAVYLTPAHNSSLEAAATAWFGRSAFARPPGRAGAVHPPMPARAPVAARSEIPARYGFHATLRSPFRLREGVGEADLMTLFDQTYGGGPIMVALEVTPLRHFVALTARQETHATLHAAEERALSAFEAVRAPLNDTERARRQPDDLDERGRALLDAWGYPHVLERFTFHMTLSGPIDGDVSSIVAAAKTHFASALGQPIPLYHAIYREDEADGPFTVLSVENAPSAAARGGDTALTVRESS